MPIQIKEAVKEAGNAMSLQKKYPIGFNIVVFIVAFIGGNFWGRLDGSDENKRLTIQVEKLQNNQVDILKASLEKNGIISYQDQKNQTLKAKNDTLKQTNDTLSSTINQVGQALLEAKKPALKILNK